MLRRLVLSLIAATFFLGMGTAFAADIHEDLNNIGKETSKAEVLSELGEPTYIVKDFLGRDKYIYIQDGQRIEVLFKDEVVWAASMDSSN